MKVITPKQVPPLKYSNFDHYDDALNVCMYMTFNAIYIFNKTDYIKNLHKPDHEVILLHCPELSNVSVRLSRELALHM